MSTFVAAYVIVWLAVLAFVARMGSRQRQLQNTVDALQRKLEQCEELPTVKDPQNKAA